MQLIVLENFHVFVPQGKRDDGTDKPEAKFAWARGQTLQAADIPENQTAEGWIAKGLVREA